MHDRSAATGCAFVRQLKCPAPVGRGLAHLLCLVSLIFSGNSGIAKQGHDFTVSDSIAMTQFSRDPETATEIAPIWSPNRTRFVVVSVRGLVASNELESTIRVFDQAAVKSCVTSSHKVTANLGRVLVRMTTTANGDPITNVKWSYDGLQVAFLGRHKSLPRHLFVVRLNDGALEQMSPDAEDVNDYAWASKDLIYTSRSLATDNNDYQAGGATLLDIEVGTGKPLLSLLFPHSYPFTAELRPVYLHRVRNGHVTLATARVGGRPLTLVNTQLLSLSPSARYLVVTEYAPRVPKSWELYQPSRSVYSRFRADEPGVEPRIDLFRPQQYAIIDLTTGDASPLFDAPIASGAAAYYADTVAAVWAADEREVVVSNTFLPVRSDDTERAGDAKYPCAAAAVRVSNREVQCLEQTLPYDGATAGAGIAILLGMEWRDSHRTLALQYSGHFDERNPLPELFHKVDGKWKPYEHNDANSLVISRADRHQLLVTIEQGLNSPPVLAATDPVAHLTKTIWDPNPQLTNVRVSPATTYKWRDRSGHEWTGGLVKPLDWLPSKRYPLVIQTHGFDGTRFLTDGAYSTANAARALASRGLMVLQVREIADAFGTADEARVEGLPGYVSAIEQLKADGLIDSSRVGIIGFSRTGWYVLDSLIRAPQYFRAATLAESIYMSFSQYLQGADFYGPSRLADEVVGIGSEPFGRGLTPWLTDSPGFNTDRIRAPVLFEANNPMALIGAWDIYGSLRLQGKPAELLYIRNGEHVLRRPRELLASQEMTVDWYDFWLNEHEDPNPAKADQFRRWRELRRLRDALPNATQ